MKKYSFVIGRFQHFHRGHEFLLREAKRHAENLVVLVGSANVSPSIRNPYPYFAREEAILAAELVSKVVPLFDFPYDDRLWVSQVREIMEAHAPLDQCCIVGSNKDESTYYLNIFGDIEVIDTPQLPGGTNATKIREALFNDWPNIIEQHECSIENVQAVLKTQRRHIDALRDEYHAVQRYRKSWARSPFPPVFVTVDNLVVHRDKFLAVIRKGHPSKGLLALPGGFVNEGERIKSAAFRELREETSIEITNPVTGAKIPFQEEWFRDCKVFDNPGRSTRGRTITHGFSWLIPDKYTISVQAADDAADVVWLPLRWIQDPWNATKFMEDHFFLVQSLSTGL